MVKLVVLLLSCAIVFGLNAQTIPNDFKPQKTNNQPTINKDLSKKEGQSFNNLSHPLSITGVLLTIAGAGLYVVGSETLEKRPITDGFLENYSPQVPLQYIGMGAFVTGGVLFAIFSTDKSVKAPKRKKEKSYNASEWELKEE
jgi:hypothetical protein